MKKLMVLMVVGALSARGDSDVDPPTEPVAAITTPDEGSPSGKESPLPGLSPVSYIGRRAADPTWCGNTNGLEEAIEISTTLSKAMRTAVKSPARGGHGRLHRLASL